MPTTDQTSQPAPTVKTGSRRRESAFVELTELAATCKSSNAVLHEALRIIADDFQSPYACVQASSPTGTIHDHVETNEGAGTWSRIVEASALEASNSGIATARLYEVGEGRVRVGVLSAPIRAENLSYSGAAALVTGCRTEAEAQKKLFELRAMLALVNALPSVLPGNQADGVQDDMLKALSKTADYQTLTELAFAITNGVKSKFGCDQAILGRVRGSRVAILSISGMDGVFHRSPGSHLIRQAMEECLDTGDIISCHVGTSWTSAADAVDYRLHRQWHSAIAGGAVASIPLQVGGETVAIVSVVRQGSERFTRKELEMISDTVSPFAPTLPMVYRASRGVTAHILSRARLLIRQAFQPKQWGRKLAFVATMALFSWFALGTMDYQISVPCAIQANDVRHFAAPFDGTIASAAVSIGDRVQANQVLYEMDTADLRLELSQLDADIEVARLELSQALADDDVAAASLARGKLRVLDTQRATVAEKIRQAKVVSPCDGVVVEGELKRRVGEVVPLGTTLLKIAADDSWRVELRVPEEDVLEFGEGTHGRFATLARPADEIQCAVERIHPTSEANEGKNIFVVRANVTDHPEWMRVGMEGVATMDIGQRRVWWVTLHRLIDFVRLHTWR